MLKQKGAPKSALPDESLILFPEPRYRIEDFIPYFFLEMNFQ